MVGWIVSEENLVKLNTDGASNHNKKAGCGGII